MRTVGDRASRPDNTQFPPGASAPRTDAIAALVAIGTILFHIATAKGYGFFRDELYYLASTEHLDFGYVEHPPMVVLIAWVTRALLGDSIYAVRFFPALAAGATVYLSATIARQIGGGRFAQVLTSLAVAFAPAYVGIFASLSMNAFDIFFWTLAVVTVVRILTTGDTRWWVAFGVVTGLGLQNKISVLFLGFGIVVGLLVTRAWEHFRSGWFWLSGLLAFVIVSPHIVWQMTHGWPTLEFIRNATMYKNLPMTPRAFMAEQLVQMNPFSIIVWGTGLIFLLFSAHARLYRALGWAYLAVLLVMVSQNSKPYYLTPMYPMLFAAGALAIEQHTPIGWKWVRFAVPALVVVTGAAIAPMAKALLPVETYVGYAAALGVKPGTEERQELGRLPQHFADMHGWPELVEAVAAVDRELPPEDRNRACVFGQNYGEAGAIDFLGRPRGLPRAISGHNSYFLWGPGDCTGDVIIVIGDEREDLEQSFEEVILAGRFTCQDCMPYENNRAIWVCRRLRIPIEEAWPRVKKFI